MPANPEVVIMLPRARYSGLYRQWEKSIADLPTATHVRLRLLLLLRAGILARENLGVPGAEPETAGKIPKRPSRRKRNPKNAKLFYVIRCRVDPRMYPDILDEWRALPHGTRSEVFAEYLRIGMKMAPDELRATAQQITKKMVWQPNTRLHEPTPASVTQTRAVETMILSDAPDSNAKTAAAKLRESFSSLED